MHKAVIALALPLIASPGKQRQHGWPETLCTTCAAHPPLLCPPTGAYHVVENISQGTTKFLQIFDHPQGGAVFAAPALVALPRNIVNSAFSTPVLPNVVSGNGAIIDVKPCPGTWS